MLGCVLLAKPVAASTTTDDTPGSRTFTVPRYNTLTVEVWGPGKGGSSYTDGSIGNFLAQGGGVATSASSVSTLSMTANGGGNGTSTSNNGGTASGGNTTNTTGTNGVSGGSSPSPVNGGTGGGSPNGGADRAGPAPLTATGTAQMVAGNAGNAPGGGGSGPAGSKTNFSGSNSYNGAIGGPGGGYSKSVYTFGVTAGFPSVGDVLSYTVAAGSASNAGTPSVPSSRGGAGAAGRVKFTVS